MACIAAHTSHTLLQRPLGHLGEFGVLCFVSCVLFSGAHPLVPDSLVLCHSQHAALGGPLAHVQVVAALQIRHNGNTNCCVLYVEPVWDLNHANNQCGYCTCKRLLIAAGNAVLTYKGEVTETSSSVRKMHSDSAARV